MLHLTSQIFLARPVKHLTLVAASTADCRTLLLRNTHYQVRRNTTARESTHTRVFETLATLPTCGEAGTLCEQFGARIMPGGRRMGRNACWLVFLEHPSNV